MSVVLGFHHYRAKINRPKSTGIGSNQYGRKTKSATSRWSLRQAAAHTSMSPGSGGEDEEEQMPLPLASPGMACCVFVSVVTVCIGIILISFGYLPPGDERPLIAIGGPVIFTLGILSAISMAVIRIRAVRRFKKQLREARTAPTTTSTTPVGTPDELDDADLDDQPDAEARDESKTGEHKTRSSSAASDRKTGSGKSQHSAIVDIEVQHPHPPVKLPPISHRSVETVVHHRNIREQQENDHFPPFHSVVPQIGISQVVETAPAAEQADDADQHLHLPPIPVASPRTRDADVTMEPPETQPMDATLVSVNSTNEHDHLDKPAEDATQVATRESDEAIIRPTLNLVSDGTRTSYIADV